MKKCIVFSIKSYIIIIRWIVASVIVFAALAGYINVDRDFLFLAFLGLCVISNIIFMTITNKNLAKIKFEYFIFIIDTALISYMFFKFDTNTGVVFFPLFFLVVFIAALLQDIKGSIATAVALVTFYYLLSKNYSDFSPEDEVESGVLAFAPVSGAESALVVFDGTPWFPPDLLA